VIESADINVFRDNDNWFNALLPAPSSAGQFLRSTSTSAAGFVNDGAGSDLDADLLDGQHGSYYATASGLAALEASAFPSGVGAWVRKASEIPTGFTRESALDGRIPVGAGTTFTVTFVEETDYGSSWSHQHTVAAHQHTYSGTASATSNTNGEYTNGGKSAVTTDHAHPYSGTTAMFPADVTPTNTSSTSWTIPSRAVVWIRKS
jgi:hypothetical protein